MPICEPQNTNHCRHIGLSFLVFLIFIDLFILNVCRHTDNTHAHTDRYIMHTNEKSTAKINSYSNRFIYCTINANIIKPLLVYDFSLLLFFSLWCTLHIFFNFHLYIYFNFTNPLRKLIKTNRVKNEEIKCLHSLHQPSISDYCYSSILLFLNARQC